MKRRKVVLHVVESFGGGVASSLVRYARNTPEFEHHLLAPMRDYTPGAELGVFSSVHTLQQGLWKALQQIRGRVKDLTPQIVHAHSSFGGAYTRLAIFSSKKRPIIYTPHGYSFERQDLNPISQLIYRAVEFLLSINTEVIAACSVRERHLSRFSMARKVTYIPNVSAASRKNRTGLCRYDVVTIGRIAPSRDPQFFVTFARALKRQNPQVRLAWIGSGHSKFESDFEKIGVEVSGWLPHAQGLDTLQDASVYVHTGAWDGFPMSILEAYSLNLAIVARKSSALGGAPDLVSSPEEMALAVSDLLSSSLSREKNRREWAAYLRDNNDEMQRKMLLNAYKMEDT